MSRVWKRFLLKIGKGVGFLTYFLLAIFVPEYIFRVVLGFESGLGVFTGMIVFMALPMIGFIIRDVYRDAKREVERENRQIMRDLGGDY